MKDLTAAQCSDEMLINVIRQLLEGRGSAAEREAVLTEVRARHERLLGEGRK